ncbi:hypothetical protein, partial [Yoonia sp. R2-816]|uniref:hypothetical protein n=1 Tax=Yoonia sp. R2-816 TaxID=3342638 RepID=UPI00372C9D28
LKAGLEVLSNRVTEAREVGGYEDMLKDAFAPLAQGRDLMPEGAAIGVQTNTRAPYPRMGNQTRRTSLISSIKDIYTTEYDKARARVLDLNAEKGVEMLIDDDPIGTPTHSGYKDYWERHALDESKRGSIYPLKDVDLFIAVRDHVEETMGGHTHNLLVRKSHVPYAQINTFMENVSEDVPKAWVQRHRDRLQYLGTQDPTPDFKSVEEFTWAIKYTATQNVLMPEGFDPEKAIGGTGGDWMNRHIRRSIADVGKSDVANRSILEKDMEDRSAHYMVDDAYIPYGDMMSTIRRVAADYETKGLSELEAENVPAEWKDRLVRTLENRHNPQEQKGVQTTDEYLWTLRFLSTTGLTRSLGRAPEPKDVAPKPPSLDMGLDLSP